MKRAGAVLSLLLLWRHDRRHPGPVARQRRIAPIDGTRLWLVAVLQVPLVAGLAGLAAESLARRLTSDPDVLLGVSLLGALVGLVAYVLVIVRATRWWRRRYR